MIQLIHIIAIILVSVIMVILIIVGILDSCPETNFDICDSWLSDIDNQEQRNQP